MSVNKFTTRATPNTSPNNDLLVIFANSVQIEPVQLEDP